MNAKGKAPMPQEGFPQSKILLFDQRLLEFSTKTPIYPCMGMIYPNASEDSLAQGPMLVDPKGQPHLSTLKAGIPAGITLFSGRSDQFTPTSQRHKAQMAAVFISGQVASMDPPG